MSDTTRVYVAIFWHQHQPYYTNDLTADTSMPWVRLHGVKDYIGMINVLEKCPEMKITVNLVPSLLKQILDQTEGGHEDRFMRLSRIPAKDLADEEKEFILGQFFQANLQHMINPLPRYRELLLKHEASRKNHKPLKSFRPQDFRDLQLLSNFAWIHPMEIGKDGKLLEMKKKGRNFSEEEKQYVLDAHLRIMSEIIPAHKRAMEAGQAELTTTPYYHPILPLLVNMESAKRCMPGVRLPMTMTDNGEYARIHVQRGIEMHTELFGRAPRGLWPAEGSVSPEIIPILAEAGIEWIATDEEILAHSLKDHIRRDAMGHVENPDLLYKPYVAESDGAAVNVFFRDHYLSDLIGFQYSANDTNSAVADFEARINHIKKSCKGGPRFVSVILDGENCWEYYHNQGIDFLTALYRRISDMDGVEPITFSEYLDKKPQTGRISRLFSGSWINHDFYIWIGDPEDVEGWEKLNRAKEFLDAKKSDEKYDKDTIDKAQEELLIAQGSDWYWWFGADHSSANDAEFDLQFRTHLKNIYRLLGEDPPGDLDVPIMQSAARELFLPPRTMIDVKMDGRVTSFFEWLGAGHYASDLEHGAMEKATDNLLADVFFGFDSETLFIRVDTRGRVAEILREGLGIRLNFIYPQQGWVEITRGSGDLDCAIEVSDSFEAAESGIRAVADKVLEITLPFDTFELREDQAVNFFVEIMKDGRVSEKAPSAAPVSVTAPSEEFDATVW